LTKYHFDTNLENEQISITSSDIGPEYMKKVEYLNSEKKTSTRVWDIWTRLFHWMLVFFIIISYLSATRAELNLTIPVLDIFMPAMQIHLFSGACIAALLTFRIIWGFVGSSTSLFKYFVFKPSQIFNSLQQNLKSAHYSGVGHSPVGGAATVVLLFSLIMQVLSGFFSEDDSFFAVTGPLSFLVSDTTKDQATVFHAFWWESVIIILIIMHLSANVFYLLVKKQNLIKPIITGYKVLSSDHVSQNLKFAPTWKAVFTLLISFLVVCFIFLLEDFTQSFNYTLLTN
jgi:cytochrome b